MKHHPDLGDPEALAIEQARMTPCTCNTEMGDTCPKCAPTPAVVPPKVGDRWGDLTPEQRAMVPVGSILGPVSDSNTLINTMVKVATDARAYCWATLNDNGTVSPPHDHDSSVSNRRAITRLGPAPTAKSSASEESPRCAETAASGERCTKLLVNGAAHSGMHTFVAGPDPMPAPTATPEPDRSGWPVLVRWNGDYRWPDSAALAVWTFDGKEWFSAKPGFVASSPFTSALAAADANKARLPDEVSEAAQTVAPQPLGRPLHPATSALLTALADADEGEVLNEVYNLERGHDADLDTAVYAWWDAGCPDAGNDILFGEVPADPRDAEIADLRVKVEAAEAELATLRAQLDARTKDRDSLDDAWTKEREWRRNAESTLSTLRGRLAFLVPDGEVTDAAIVAAVKALADHANADGQDDTLLTAGLGLLDQAALGNPTLGYIATVIRRGVGR